MMQSMQDELNARRVADFYKSWDQHKRLGFAATQEEANRIAALHGIEPPTLAPVPSRADPSTSGTLYIDFEDKRESAEMVAYLAAKAVIQLHFDVLMCVNVIANESRAPGTALPAERMRELVEKTGAWARVQFQHLGASVRYDEKR